MACGSLRTSGVGQTHKYKNCWYLNPSKRPSTFFYKDDVAKRILQNVQNPTTKKAVNKALGKHQEADIQLQNSSTFSTFDDEDFTPITSTALDTANDVSLSAAGNKFNRMWLYDTATQAHVTNDNSRITNMRQVSSSLNTGDSQTFLNWLCDTYVVLDTPSGQQKLHLQNVRYIPNFHTNVVAL